MIKLQVSRAFIIVTACAVVIFCCAISFLYLLSSKSPAGARAETTVATHKPKPTPKPFEFPAGGRVLFPRYRLVGLYGSPETPALGALGEQPVVESIARVKQLATDYQQYSEETIYPTFEIIATVAAAGPTEDGNYSREAATESLISVIQAAKDAGIYVILDLQSARANSLDQAKLYEPLLLYPNVGLALDPEWRLEPNQYPLGQIGHINIDEVNSVSAWLSDLIVRHKLPQKVFMLHQFSLLMLPNRELLDVSRTNLAYIIQMDGQGSQPSKLDTWNAIMQGAPTGVQFGWKNFYDEDTPTLSIADTMALTPKPWYVSYQ